VPETFELDALQLPPEMPLSLPAKIIEQRPDVRAAEATLHAANAQVGVAVAAMLPQFSITGSYGGNADQFSWMFRHGGPFWNLVGDVTQPIFQGGTLLHRKRAARAALKQAAAQYQSTVITAYQNVADTLHASLSDADALAAQVDAENAAKVTYDLTRRQMETGYVNYLTLLSAEAAYQQALLARVQAQAARYGDSVALFQALGGGWWNRTRKASANITRSTSASGLYYRIDDEPVADTELSEDVLRTTGVDFELSPEASDIHPQCARVIAMRAPNLLDERRVRHDPIAMARKSFQDAVLQGGQAHVASVPAAGDAPAEVDRHVAELEHSHRQLAAHMPSYDRSHPRQQLRCAERLHDVVVGAVLECSKALRFGGACRQHDDRHRRPRANGGDDVEAVAVR
jgi:hypothetical protein